VKWTSFSVPLGGPTAVQSSNFGNVILEVDDSSPYEWLQDGTFNEWFYSEGSR